MKTKNVYYGKIYVLACVPDVPMDVEKVDVRHLLGNYILVFRAMLSKQKNDYYGQT